MLSITEKREIIDKKKFAVIIFNKINITFAIYITAFYISSIIYPF